MHGRFPLGTDNTYQEHEDEPGVGIRCWLRYNSGEETFRWTIDELFEANDSQVLHVSFWSGERMYSCLFFSSHFLPVDFF